MLHMHLLQQKHNLECQIHVCSIVTNIQSVSEVSCRVAWAFPKSPPVQLLMSTLESVHSYCAIIWDAAASANTNHPPLETFLSKITDLVIFIFLSLLKIGEVTYVFRDQMPTCDNNLMNSRIPFQISLPLETVLFGVWGVWEVVFFVLVVVIVVIFCVCVDHLLSFHVGVDVLKGLFYLVCFFVDVPGFGVISF